mgnify:CR=1 FL=1
MSNPAYLCICTRPNTSMSSPDRIITSIALNISKVCLDNCCQTLQARKAFHYPNLEHTTPGSKAFP